MVRSVCHSVTLSVHYRNHFPVVRFKNQAHIWNPCGTGHVFKTIWGALGGGFSNNRRRHPNGGAKGAQRWRRGRGEGNPAKGGYFVSYNLI